MNLSDTILFIADMQFAEKQQRWEKDSDYLKIPWSENTPLQVKYLNSNCVLRKKCYKMYLSIKRKLPALITAHSHIIEEQPEGCE